MVVSVCLCVGGGDSLAQQRSKELSGNCNLLLADLFACLCDTFCPLYNSFSNQTNGILLCLARLLPTSLFLYPAQLSLSQN